jgi:hypothetical protein
MYRNGAPANFASTGTKVVLDTVNFDTGGMADTANGRIRCLVAGYYQVTANIEFNQPAAGYQVGVYIYKNGTNAAQSIQTVATTGQVPTPVVSDIVQCNAGDYLELWGTVSGGAIGPVVGTPVCTYLEAVLLTSLAGAVGTTTPARMYRNAAWTLGNAAWTKVPLDTLSYDPGGNVSLINSRYVCPATGSYQVNGAALGQAIPTSGFITVAIYKNGSVAANGSAVSAPTETGAIVADVVQCNAGDYLELWAYQSGTAGWPTYPGSAGVYFSVVQVGNLSATPASTACARVYYGSAPGSCTASAWSKANMSTVAYDTSGMWDTTNARFRAPVSGYYQINGMFGVVATASPQDLACAIYVNGSAAQQGSTSPFIGTTLGLQANAATVLQLNAGDYVELYYYCTAALTVNAGVANCSLSMALLTPLSGTTAPVTAARAYRNAALTTTATTWTKVALDTITSDAGNNMAPIANGRYLCPATGAYQVNANVSINATASGQIVAAAIYRNGAQAAFAEVLSTSSGQTPTCAVSDVIQCNAGDYLELWYYCSAALSANVTATTNYLSCVLVGNSMNFTQAGGDLTGTYPNPRLASAPRVLSASPVLDVGVSGQVRAGRQLTAADFTALGLSAPRGLWNLSDLTDASGNGRALSNQGAVAFASGINGAAATAAQFTGSTAQALYISDTGAGDPFRIATGSWGCWFRTAKTGVVQYLYAKTGTATNYSHGIYVDSTNVIKVLVCSDGTGGAGLIAQPVGVSVITDDRWHHGVAVYDATQVRVYVDGVLEATAACSGPLFGAPAALNIGAAGADSSTAASNPNFGRIDEAFVTADVLSADQVRALYCAKFAHGLTLTPTIFRLAVRRARKGGTLSAASDFPGGQPLRLYNFTAGSLNDEGTNSQALTVSAGSVLSVAGADGATGAGQSFNQSGSLQATDAGLPSATATRSYGCWFKTTGPSSGAYGFMSWGTISTGEARLDMTNTGQVRCLSAGDVISGPYTADGQWHHAVAVEDNAAVDGVKRKLYLDGQLGGGSTTLNAITLAGANRFHVGSAPDGTNILSGQIDGAFVCGYALTQDQVSILYAKGSQQLPASRKNEGDHVEYADASFIYATFDTLDTQTTVDLGVGG